jgi:flagellar biosynthesis protein FlhA
MAETRQLNMPNWLANADIMMGVGVMAILGIMILPIPSLLLDLLLSASITLGVIILMVAMYILRPLEFSVFPSVLLLTTLFRLALNVASTRLILLHGSEGTDAAGQVIKAFGNFVVGGNFAVGLVVFLILVIINFIVITKGAGRIAEVAARFTLDAMPGKQMSIDADLNAGIINEREARRRREDIAREADFYGSMDGASKFVRGDAIAGILIMLINIIGGFIIGVFQYGMDIPSAAQTFTILTVGDGLVAQIPALVISTAAGMVVTRAASASSLGRDIASQVFVHPKAIYTASAILLALGLVPGLPHLAFITLSAVTGFVAYTTGRIKAAKAETPREEKHKATPAQEVEALLSLDTLALELGYRLIPMVDAGRGGELLNKIRQIRKQFAAETGIIVPSIHIRDNLQLEPNSYSFLIKGMTVASGEAMPDRFMALNPGNMETKISGIETRDPAFGLPAAWIAEADKEKAQFAGYTVVDPATVIATHVTEILKMHAHELIGRQEAQSLLDNLSKESPKVVEELVPNLLPLGGVVKVLQNLLRERVSIRDIKTILETLADYAPLTKNPELLTEYVRQALSRSITRQCQAKDGTVPVVIMDPKVEEAIAGGVQTAPQGSYLALEPGLAQRILTKVNEALELFNPLGQQPVLLCSPSIRGHVKRFTEKFFPNLVVLSHNEITTGTRINSIGSVRLDNE